MQHLRIERLAELADGEPTAAELEHLDQCAMCAAERAAYQRVVAMAADERRRIAPPITTWGSLRSELRSQGIITSAAEADARQAWSERISRAGGRIAAALAFLALGVVGGRLSAGLSVPNALALGDPAGGATLTSWSADEFASNAQALQALQRAQQEYERAALYLANHDTSAAEVESELLRTRLAALDEMAETSLRALGDAPADPIMNQVYLTTLGARNMTLGRLATALPVGARLSRF
jgi:hypothetical protein